MQNSEINLSLVKAANLEGLD